MHYICDMVSNIITTANSNILYNNMEKKELNFSAPSVNTYESNEKIAIARAQEEREKVLSRKWKTWSFVSPHACIYTNGIFIWYATSHTSQSIIIHLILIPSWISYHDHYLGLKKPDKFVCHLELIDNYMFILNIWWEKMMARLQWTNDRETALYEYMHEPNRIPWAKICFPDTKKADFVEILANFVIQKFSFTLHYTSNLTRISNGKSSNSPSCRHMQAQISDRKNSIN